MKTSTYLITLFATALFVMGIVGGVNSIYDPYLFFDSEHSVNDIFDSRQQKSNRILSSSFSCDFNTLLFGSSRVMMMGDFEYNSHKVINLALQSLVPEEIYPFLNLYINRCKKEPQTIILALDFMGSSAHPFRETITPIDEYIKKANSFKFKLSSLFSLGLLKQSLAMISRSVLGRNTYREVARNKFISPLFRQYKKIYSDYEWNRSYEELLTRIKSRSPSSNFIVVTSPVSKLLYEMMLSHHLRPHYERWLRTLTKHFDFIIHCMDLNKVTENPRLFRDENHLWTSVTKDILPKTFFMQKNEFSPDDFGKKLTRENINEYLSSN